MDQIRICDVDLIRKASFIANEEFEALDTLVTVVPSASFTTFGAKWELFSGEVGPFSPHMPTDVPLWLALYLERTNRCSIEAPEWLNAAHLRQQLAEEKRLPSDEFTDVHEHYLELAHVLLNQRPWLRSGANGEVMAAGSQDALGGPKAQAEIRVLLEDILNIRRHKIREGIKMLDTDVANLDVSKLSRLELACVRSQSLSLMDKAQELLAIREGGGATAASAGG
ncbi:DNA replication complex GINS protein PSF2 [Perkinsus chesapeaki]|uniref:DNA replication complex GINS protein PSF2 n=1 Tax=Perkinsus chesapeaki TaxID=330153 RepID=A0A7J6N040_PERCH|nr:DNA replication complex GINS protein PSF2 [Perkinsus chesapeaki]